MNLGFYLPRFVGGGAELITTNLANALLERGHSTHLIVDIEGPDRAFFHPRCPVYVLGSSGLFGSAQRLSTLIEELELDVLISTLPIANLVADLSHLRSSRRPVRIINTWHGYFRSVRGLKGRIGHLACGPLSRIADHNVAVSVDLSRELRAMGVPQDRLSVIYNGIDIPGSVEPLAWPRPYIFSAGSLTAHKNHELLIRAFADVRASLDWDLIIAGQGPLHDRLLRIASQMNVADRVHLVGFRDDIFRYHAGAQMFVLPSNVESFGLVLLEALSVGTPVVSTRSGGPVELLDDGRFGRLVPRGDRAALAAAILDTAREPVERERLKARAQFFSLSRAAKEYEELCQRVLARSDAVAPQRTAARAVGSSAVPATARRKILVNHTTPYPNAITGITVYTWKILEALARSGRYSYVLATNWDTASVPPVFRELGVEIVHMNPVRNESLSWIKSEVLVPRLVRRFGCDLVFTPHSFSPITANVPSVSVVHDIRRATHPELHRWPTRAQWNAIVPLALRRSSAVIAVSGATRDAVAGAYPEVIDRVRVVQEASPIAFSSGLPPPPVETPYGLMVANVTSIKNFQVLVSALTKLLARGANPCICFVGRNDSSDDAVERARSLGLNLRILGSLDEETLKRYYAHARFYLNTSLVEGFCLPILEAHTFGLPVICSDLPVLHEVAGDGALFFDPRDDDMLADAIFRILQDDALAQRLSAAARQNARRFSWERAATETESVFETLLRRPEHALGTDVPSRGHSLTA